MAPRQANRNIERQRSVTKDEKAQSQDIKKERPQISSRERIVSKDRNTKPKHLLSSSTSNTSDKEFPQVEVHNPAPDEPLRKRRRTSPSTNSHKEKRGETRKRSRASQAIHELTNDRDYNPVAYWAANCVWPKDYALKGAKMSEPTSKKRKRESTHRSDRVERLAENGVFMISSNLIQKSSKSFCLDLLKGDRMATGCSPFPPEQLRNVLDRVTGLNEGRVQRDVTPWVVPSAEILFFCGELDVDYIGDEVNAEWTRCATMGSTRPKPDYAAGLLPSAFSKDEIQKLKIYASSSRPVFFTPDLCFPFLICEVKTGEQGLNKADRQNIHSASIAVRAVIELFRAAFGSASDRVKELYGQVLAFTVSHDNDRVSLYGHYAVATEGDDELQFFRYQIALISLSAKDGADKFVPYNFVRNLYEKFVPEHRQRITDATALLPESDRRTNISFSASELTLEETQSRSNSQDTQSQDNVNFKMPELSASVMYRNEVVKLRQQMEQQREDARLQREQMERQMEQLREDARRQMEQLREDARRQMEQQMEQLEQQKEIISLLKQRME